MRTTKPRPYRMRRRAELVGGTRLRITEATAQLHTTIGPAATTIAAIADAAGVTRLTVYRHFPDLDELFASCQAHWLAESRPPDPRSWQAIPDLRARATTALGELYRWYRDHADELFPINRDAGSMPDSARRRFLQGQEARVDGLVGDRPEADAAPSLRGAARVVTSYWTWRTLAVDQGLGDDEAVELAVAFLLAAAGVRPTARTATRRRAGQHDGRAQR